MIMSMQVGDPAQLKTGLPNDSGRALDSFYVLRKQQFLEKPANYIQIPVQI